MWIYADSLGIYIYMCAFQVVYMIDSFLFGRSFRPGGFDFLHFAQERKVQFIDC